MMRRTLIASSFLLALFGTVRADAPAHGSPAPAAASAAAAIDADAALAILKDGNARFVAGESTFPNLDQDRRCFTTDGGQHPYAAILSCADSRVPPELLFDSGIGDLFVVRVAGNVADTDEIGTLEYGAGHLNIPLIVVIGHTKCGAVTAVVKNATVHGSIPKLVDNIGPAVAETRAKYGGVPEAKLVQYATRANVFQSVKDILTRSQEIRELVAQGKVQVVGAVYDIHNGTLDWLGEHPQQTALLKETSHEANHDAAHEPAEAKADAHDGHAPASSDDHAAAHADPADKADNKTNAHAAATPAAKPAAKAAATLTDGHDDHAKPATAKKPAAAAKKAADAHGAKDDHGATDAHGAKDAHGDEHGESKGEAGHDEHATDEHAAAEGERESLAKKHGLLVPGVFLAAGSILSGTIVFVLKSKPHATPAAPHDAHADAKPAH